MIAGGRPYCDNLVAELRIELDDLQPTPNESIDPPLESWIERLRTLAFECPADPQLINAELTTIGTLEAEILLALSTNDNVGE